MSSDGTLTWAITPGVYLLYFPQHQFREGPPKLGELYPNISVTYRVQSRRYLKMLSSSRPINIPVLGGLHPD